VLKIGKLSDETIKKALQVDILFMAQKMGEDFSRVGRSYFTYRNEGENTPSLCITPSKGLWKDFGGTDGGNTAVSFYAYRCFGNSNPKGKDFIDAVKAVCILAGIPIQLDNGEIEQGSGLNSLDPAAFRKKEEDESAPKEKPERLDFVYRCWMQRIPLTQNHIDHLKNVRKITAAVMKLREYRSFVETKSERYQSMKAILRVTGEPIGIPGFALCSGPYGPYWTVIGRAGLLLPHRDLYNRICGFQIRFDEPPKIVRKEGPIRVTEKSYNDLQVINPSTGEILWEGSRQQLPIVLTEGKVYMENGSSYGWLASLTYKKRGLLLGTEMAGHGCTLPYHCAIPSHLIPTWKPGTFVSNVMNTRMIWWGEGPLKGDIASDFTQQLHLQVPGVSSWRALLEPTLQLNPEEVIVGFDADAQTKDGVQGNVINCIKEAKKELSPRGIKVKIGLWPFLKGKGIDDLMNNGYRPMIIEI